MSFVDQKISFFDLEKKLLPGLNNIENIIESKIKYVDDITNHAEILKNIKKVFNATNKENYNFELICCTQSEINELKNYIDNVKVTQYEILKLDKECFYKIIFKNKRCRNLCLFSCSNRFKFYGIPTVLNVNELIGLKSLSKEPDRISGTDIPINYNKIVLGPLDTTVDELSEFLCSIGLIVSLRTTTLSNFFTFSFLDSDLNKSFVDVLTKKKENNKDVVEARFCYKDCIILNIEEICGVGYSIPIPCSLITTKIVLLSNSIQGLDVKTLITNRCGGINKYKILYYDPFDKFKELQFKIGHSRVFIECSDLKTAEIIYYSLGGFKIDDCILATSFYPEYNFYAGEFE